MKLVANPGRTPLVAFVVAIAGIAAIGYVALNQRTTATPDQIDRIPGHVRTIMHHDWPHPRDYRFAPSTFRAADPAIAGFKTTSGTRAYIIPDRAARVVRVTVAFPLGRLYEHPDEVGASDLLVQILTQRAWSSDAQEVRARIEALGLPSSWFEGGLNLMNGPFSGEEAAGAAPPKITELPDGTSLSLEVLPDDWRHALTLLTDLIQRPAFAADVKAYRTGPDTLPISNPAASNFLPVVELERTLAGYPIAPPESGHRVTAAAMRNLALRTFTADRVVFGIGGNVARIDVEAALNTLTQHWPSNSHPSEPAEPPSEPPRAARPKLIEAPGISGWVAIGRVIGPVPDAEQPALAVMAELLDTRLNISTRERRGLTNRDMFLLPETRSGAGLASIRTGARPESIAPLIKLSIDEVARLARPDDPITTEELDRARGTLVLGPWQAALDGAPQTASTYALEAMRGQDPETQLKWPYQVQAVTADQVRTAAQKYLPVDQLSMVVIGPIEVIRKARHPRWPASLDDVVGNVSTRGAAK